MRRLLPIFLAGFSVAFAAPDHEGEKRANRLAREKSPYLLQHAYNPVDWYPWGDEAFEKAKAEKKLILLSVGYSTCHWCHVMERESFESEKIATFLNKNFVSIKLDREERPDVDQVYMTAFRAMTGESGGWPLNMFLTPDLKPLTGGTYFPPEDQGGRPGFLTVLTQMHKVWTEKREMVSQQAEEGFGQLKEHFQSQHQLKAGKDQLKKELLTKGAKSAASKIDPEWGGFGRDQKFPQVSALRFLLQSGDKEAQEKVLMTCRRMMDGGIHDQVAGGFHRYAVDREWLVPHFEKMLYDQAQLLDLYCDAWLLTGEKDFATAARGIVTYVLRDLRHKDGGFYCAQDAQSEGKEGKYWAWTLTELKKVLTEEELKIAQSVFGVTQKGNFLDHSDPEPLLSQNVLHFKKRRATLSPEERKVADVILKKLAPIRAKRVPPSTDDKILASWNGLMIGALARAGRVLGESSYLIAARQAHDFVKKELWDEKSGKLYHSWREGERTNSIQAPSYLHFIEGTRRLYQVELKAADLAFALKLADGAKSLFYDEKNGGFFQGEVRDDLVFRLKGDFDGAMPTESAVGAKEFQILGSITGRQDLLEVAEKTLRVHLTQIEQAPAGMGGMLTALQYYLGDKARLVLAGETGREAMLQEIYQHWHPHLVVMANTGAVEEFAKTLKSVKEKATAYFCVGQSCQLPQNTIAGLRKVLKK